MPLFFERKIATMPKKYPAEVRDRAVRMVNDRLSEYPSVFAACKALAPKLDVGPRITAALGAPSPGRFRCEGGSDYR